MPSLRGVLFASLLALLASGCSTATKVRSMFGGELPFAVTIAADANENSAVAVDLVVVYDDKVLEQLMKMRASEWFVRKPQFLRDFGNELDVKEWEWVPSQIVTPGPIAYRAGAKKIVLFADYASEGDHRAVVDPQQSVLLVLDTLDLDVKDLGKVAQ